MATIRTIPNGRFAGMMDAVLQRGAAFRFAAGGASMSPFIRDGDVLTLTPVGTCLRLGEVVAFRHPESGRLTVHRAIARGKRGLLLRGDNSSQSDGRVPPRLILGRVQSIKRQGRRVGFGLGPERLPIALFSRLGLLRPLVMLACRLLRPVHKRFFA